MLSVSLLLDWADFERILLSELRKLFPLPDNDKIEIDYNNDNIFINFDIENISSPRNLPIQLPKDVPANLPTKLPTDLPIELPIKLPKISPINVLLDKASASDQARELAAQGLSNERIVKELEKRGYRKYDRSTVGRWIKRGIPVKEINSDIDNKIVELRGQGLNSYKISDYLRHHFQIDMSMMQVRNRLAQIARRKSMVAQGRTKGRAPKIEPEEPKIESASIEENKEFPTGIDIFLDPLDKRIWEMRSSKTSIEIAEDLGLPLKEVSHRMKMLKNRQLRQIAIQMGSKVVEPQTPEKGFEIRSDEQLENHIPQETSLDFSDFDSKQVAEAEE